MNRKQVPPVSLLRLAKCYDLGQSELLLKRCQTLCLFKELKPWAIKSYYYQYHKNEVTLINNNDANNTQDFPLAMIATDFCSRLKDIDRSDKTILGIKKFTGHFFGSLQSSTVI